MRPRTVALLAALAAVGVQRWRHRAAQRPVRALLPPGPPVVVPPSPDPPRPVVPRVEPEPRPSLPERVEDELPSGWEVVELAPPVARPPAPDGAPGAGELRRRLRSNDVPVWFVAPSPFGLLGIDRWIRRFTFVSAHDPFDGAHPNVVVPARPTHEAGCGVVGVAASLLADEDVRARIRAEGGGKALFLTADAELERVAEEAGLEVALPAAALCARVASKIELTRLAHEAGVPSVPNVLGRARSYEGLVSLARGAGLGDDLVVQTSALAPARTTFFVATAAEWDEQRDQLVDEHLKVMRRIRCRQVSVDAVVTRNGTLVGRLLTERTALPALSPSTAGWCAVRAPSSVVATRHREVAREAAERMGARLAREGYKGCFSLDLLADRDTDELYLEALRPGLPAASALSDVTAVGNDDLPLTIFHLAAFLGLDDGLDQGPLTAEGTPGETDDWSVLGLQAVADAAVVAAPESGIWRLDDGTPGSIRLVRHETDWRSLSGDEEAFVLRLVPAGGRCSAGDDLVVVVTRRRLLTDVGALTVQGSAWVDALGRQLRTSPAPDGGAAPTDGLS